MPIDEARLRKSLEALSGNLQGDLEATLREVARSTCVIFDAAGAGVMLIDDNQVLHYVGATDPRSAALEAAQEEAGEGPCVDSLIHDVVVMTSDIATDPRWPVVSEAVGGLGIHAVLGVPIHIGGSTVGSLNTYRDRAGEWHNSEVAAIQAHARVIEELLGTAILAREKHTIAEQLRHALESRVVIERAVGVVMARRGIDAVGAFNELRLEARSQRRRVVDVAQSLIDEFSVATGDAAHPDTP